MQMKYFVSHAYKDREWAKKFPAILLEADKSINQTDIFFSSTPEMGSDAKRDLLNNIDFNMNSAKVIILIVTDNFLRSKYCYYELNVASYLKRMGKEVIIVIQSPALIERIKEIFPDALFVCADDTAASATLLKQITNTPTDELHAATEEFFNAMTCAPLYTDIPFIGMDPARFDNAFSFIEKHKIEKMTFGYPSDQALFSQKLSGAEEIIFVSTTGSGFLKTYKQHLIEAISLGANLSVVMADRDSDFSNDVGDIELFEKNVTKEILNANRKRIAGEFDTTVQFLSEICREAKKQGGENVGEISCFSGYTLIRQTAFIVRYADNTAWGWITCTMPPARSADKTTPSVVIGGSVVTDTFIGAVFKYCKTLIEFAKSRDGYFKVIEDTVPRPFSRIEQKATDTVNIKEFLDEAKRYWIQKREIADSNMKIRESVYDSVLIEVAAQHPLFKKREPNREFKQRLNKAIELYRDFKEKGIYASFYVPGSRHKFGGIADDISLSDAGRNYLISQGIPDEDIFGDAENHKYKGDDGVYNSADECFVSSKIFFDGDFGKLICVCSPNQIMRKSMLYLEFGCIPVFYGVTTENMYHANAVDEIFNSLNSVLYFDHSWQDPATELYKYFRKERNPDYEQN